MLNPRNRRQFPGNWDVHVARHEIQQEEELVRQVSNLEDSIRRAEDVTRKEKRKKIARK